MYLVLSYIGAITSVLAVFLWIVHFFAARKSPERFARRVWFGMLAFLAVAVVCLAVRDLFA